MITALLILGVLGSVILLFGVITLLIDKAILTARKTKLWGYVENPTRVYWSRPYEDIVAFVAVRGADWSIGFKWGFAGTERGDIREQFGGTYYEADRGGTCHVVDCEDFAELIQNAKRHKVTEGVIEDWAACVKSAGVDSSLP